MMPKHCLPGFTSSSFKESRSDQPFSSSCLAPASVIHLRILGTGAWGLLGLAQAAYAQVCRAPSHHHCLWYPGQAAACFFLANFSSILSNMGEYWATWRTIITFILNSDILTFKHLLSHSSPNRKTISALLGVYFTAHLLITEAHFRRDSWGPVNVARAHSEQHE